jgi:hypothetical protein
MLPEDLKPAIRVACVATSNVTIATALNPGDSLGGRTLVQGDLILLAGQLTAAQNGLYVCSDVPVRHPDYDSYENGGKFGPEGAYDRFPGMTIIDEQTGDSYICTSVRGGTLGTTALAFTNLFSTASSSELASMLAAMLTNRGDILRRGASAPERYALGSAGTILGSDGTDVVYRTLTAWFDAVFTGEADGQLLARIAGSWVNSTLTAYLDAALTGEANGDLLGRTGGAWTNRTLAAVLGDMLTTRGDLFLRGASAVARLALGAANTVLRSDGTDAAWGPVLDYGSYTPALYNTVNLSASSAYVTRYIRVGDLVIVFGKVDADAVSASSTATTLGIGLPIASDFVSDSQCAGVGAEPNSGIVCRINCTTSGSPDRATMLWDSLTTANAGFSFIFGYVIL